jgi:host factor-I protein
MEKGSSPDIQNDFFNQARREKSRVQVFLNSGKKLTGRIKSFDRFTLILENGQGDQMVFKHAIATVSTARTFGNYMNFDAARGKEASAPAGSGEDRGGGGEPPSPRD